MTRRDWSLGLATLLGGKAFGGQFPPNGATSVPQHDAPQSQAAQNPAPENDQSVIRVDVDLVNILFTVHQKKGGALVPNLSKDDFTIFEDGKQQTISKFNKDTDLAVTIGLLVDVSASQVNLIETERDAASAFFSSVIRQKDLAFLITFGKDTELVQDLTSSTRTLRAGLGQMRGDIAPGSRGVVIPNPGAIPTGNNPKGTLMFDAIYLAANEKLKNEAGRKAIVLITDGEDQGSYYKREQAIEAAQRSDSIVYSFYYVDPYFYGRGMIGGGGGESALKRMSQETGGRVFSIDRKHTLQEAFTELQEEMRNQYVISYTPTNATRDGSFRKIEIKTSNKDYAVQARRGYYATPNNDA